MVQGCAVCVIDCTYQTFGNILQNCVYHFVRVCVPGLCLVLCSAHGCSSILIVRGKRYNYDAE